jgi:hypothetical protein
MRGSELIAVLLASSARSQAIWSMEGVGGGLNTNSLFAPHMFLNPFMSTSFLVSSPLLAIRDMSGARRVEPCSGSRLLYVKLIS